jgi:hypothetical protein
MLYLADADDAYDLGHVANQLNTVGMEVLNMHAYAWRSFGGARQMCPIPVVWNSLACTHAWHACELSVCSNGRSVRARAA